jgi:hypothetical protein
MKTSKLKSVGFIFAATLSLASSSFAGDQSALSQGLSTNPPQVAQTTGSSALDEGTETTISPERMAALQAYLTKSNATLKGLLDDISGQPYRKAKEILVAGIRSTVISSDPKASETLLRWVLNRGLKTVEQIDKIADNTKAGVVDQEVRILKHSIEMALEYYENDIAYVNSLNSGHSVQLPYAKFGIEYVQFIMPINESLLNSQASYMIAIRALSYFAVDMSKDQSFEAYGPVIGRLESFLKTHPLTAPSSREAVREMREIRKKYYETIRDAREVVVASNN